MRRVGDTLLYLTGPPNEDDLGGSPACAAPTRRSSRASSARCAEPGSRVDCPPPPACSWCRPPTGPTSPRPGTGCGHGDPGAAPGERAAGRGRRSSRWPACRSAGSTTGRCSPRWWPGRRSASVLVSVVLRRAPAWLVAPVSVLALAGYAAVRGQRLGPGRRGRRRPAHPRCSTPARNAVPRLLTALIPVEPQPDTVLGPVVLAWLAGFAGAELAARARRTALALLPPTLLYAGALVLVGPNAPAVARGSRWRSPPWPRPGSPPATRPPARARLPGLDAAERTALRLRAGTGLAAGLLAVAGGGRARRAAGGPAGRPARPTDPRRYVAPPSLDVLDQNPLIRISGWAANPEQHLFDVAVVGGRRRRPPPPRPPRPRRPPPTDPSVVAGARGRRRPATPAEGRAGRRPAPTTPGCGWPSWPTGTASPGTSTPTTATPGGCCRRCRRRPATAPRAAPTWRRR